MKPIKGMKGTYVLPAIPPHVKELRVRCEVVQVRGDKIRLQELRSDGHLIETDLDRFIPDKKSKPI